MAFSPPSAEWATLVGLGAATDAANAIATLVRLTGPQGIAVGSVIQAVDTLASLLLTGCDGTVAAQSWAFTAAQLAEMTAGKTGWTETRGLSWQSEPCGLRRGIGLSRQLRHHGDAPRITVQARWHYSAGG